MFKKNWTLLIGAFFGLTAVMLGAYTNHVMRGSLDAHSLTMMSTALLYQQLHAIVIVVIGLTLYFPLPEKVARRLKVAGGLFIVGVLAFSFSIYVAAITGMTEFIKVTPTGGFLLMVGWVMIGFAALSRR